MVIVKNNSLSPLFQPFKFIFESRFETNKQTSKQIQESNITNK